MIIGVDLNNDKKAWGERFGMTHFVNPKEVDGDIVPYLVNMTKRGADQIGGADYTFDCTGNTKVMRQALEASHRGWGKSVVIGVAGAGQEISTRPFQLVTGRTWMGTAFGGARGRTDVPKIVDWYMDGKIQIDPMITHTHAARGHQQGLRPDAPGQVHPQRRGLLSRDSAMPDPIIYVDADACPVKAEAEKVADRLGLVVTFVSNGGLAPLARSDGAPRRGVQGRGRGRRLDRRECAAQRHRRDGRHSAGRAQPWRSARMCWA